MTSASTRVTLPFNALLVLIASAFLLACKAPCVVDCRGSTDLLATCTAEMSCNIDGEMLRQCPAAKSGRGVVPCAVPLQRGATLSTSTESVHRRGDDEIVITLADAADLVDLRIAADGRSVDCQRVDIELVCGPIASADRTFTVTNGRESPLLLLGLSLRARRRICGERADSCGPL